MNRNDRVAASAILALILSLLLVGVVSGTLLRHVVQVIPAVFAGILLRLRPAWGRAAAVPIFTFWLVIMGVIWLTLLHIAPLVKGHFTTVEVCLTVAIGVASIAGAAGALRSSPRLAWYQFAVAFILFAGIQFGFMLLSFKPQIANR